MCNWGVSVLIETSAVAFDGEKVLATPRARLAITKRMIIANTELGTIRGSPGYDLRLLKYATRGFGVASFEKINYKNENNKNAWSKIINVKSFLEKNYGLKLLAMVAENHELMPILLEQKQP